MSPTAGLKAGLTGLVSVTVNETNTAVACGSGSVEVFATPAMVSLIEQAALSAINSQLPPGYTTVGTSISLRHVAATPINGWVEAKAELMEVDGRRLVFKVEAFDQSELVGHGTHQRFVVDAEKFVQKAAQKII